MSGAGVSILMKALWTKLCKLGSEWFSVILVAIVCISCLFVVNYQNSTSADSLERIQKIYQEEIELRDAREKELSGTFSEYFIRQKLNSELKDTIIDRQRQIIQLLLKKLELNSPPPYDPDKIT